MSENLPGAILFSLIAGVAAGVGAVPVLFLRRIHGAVQAGLMGVGAGVMLGAAFFSLTLPALELGKQQLGSGLLSGLAVTASLAVGGGLVALADRFIPHEHFMLGPEGGTSKMSRAWLFMLAIGLHNFPEGMAMGVGFATGQDQVSLPLAAGIAVHNFPEGLVVAAALVKEGYGPWRSVGLALATGLVEPVAAVPGYLAVSLVRVAMVPGLAIAAGTMLYVVSDEIIPESHQGQTASVATWGTLAGFAVMLLLDSSFR